MTIAKKGTAKTKKASTSKAKKETPLLLLISTWLCAVVLKYRPILTIEFDVAYVYELIAQENTKISNIVLKNK